MAEEFDHKALAESFAEGARLDEQLGGSDSLEFAAADAAANPIDALCNVWRTVRGPLEWVSNFPLVPANIRRVLKGFIGVVNTLCGGNN